MKKLMPILLAAAFVFTGPWPASGEGAGDALKAAKNTKRIADLRDKKENAGELREVVKGEESTREDGAVTERTRLVKESVTEGESPENVRAAIKARRIEAPAEAGENLDEKANEAPRKGGSLVEGISKEGAALEKAQLLKQGGAEGKTPEALRAALREERGTIAGEGVEDREARAREALMKRRGADGK